MSYDINGDGIISNQFFDVNGNEVIGSVYDINGNEIPLGSVDISKRHDVVYSQGDIYALLIGTTLHRSMDGGNSFPVSIDVSQVGTIKNIHIFTDGTLNIFGHRTAFYSDDWVSLHPSTILDENGDQYTPDTYDTFSVTKHNPQIPVIGGKELYVFGNYCITNEYNQRKNIWYTIDKGHTYKVAYAFGLSGCRHVHGVFYNESDSSFWAYTGDSGTECKVLKGIYNATNDAWVWDLIAQGSDFKFSGLCVYDNMFYWCKDYTPGAVMKAPYLTIADVTTHETVLDNLPNDCVTLVIDYDTGEMLVGLSIYRTGTSPSQGSASDDCRRLYYSSDGITFDYVTGEIPDYYPYSDTMYYGVFPLNNDKKILSGLWSRAHENLDAWDKVPSIWLDDIVRSKWPNAFQQTTS